MLLIPTSATLATPNLVSRMLLDFTSLQAPNRKCTTQCDSSAHGVGQMSPALS